jgi:predicted AlkP superfamily pyrophosphatase or phosphodiesterase
MGRLIICIDGLGKDLISKEDTPFLYGFAKKNYFVELETLFAFTGIEYSFFSGKTPEEHGIWLEFVRSKNSIFANSLLRFLFFSKK